MTQTYLTDDWAATAEGEIVPNVRRDEGPVR